MAAVVNSGSADARRLFVGSGDRDGYVAPDRRMVGAADDNRDDAQSFGILIRAEAVVELQTCEAELRKTLTSAQAKTAGSATT